MKTAKMILPDTITRKSALNYPIGSRLLLESPDKLSHFTVTVYKSDSMDSVITKINPMQFGYTCGEEVLIFDNMVMGLETWSVNLVK